MWTEPGSTALAKHEVTGQQCKFTSAQNSAEVISITTEGLSCFLCAKKEMSDTHLLQWGD